MPNLYIAPAEIKDIAPDFIRAATTKYDDALLRLINQISRAIDDHCNRHFHPLVEARYFTAWDGKQIKIDDLISLTSLKTDDDGDRTYETTWTATDYDLMPYNEKGSHWQISIAPEGNYSFPLNVAKGVEVTGVWGKVHDRSACFEDSGQDLEDDPITAAATTLNSKGDVDGDDLYGISPAFAVGLLIQLESELCEVTGINTTTDALTLIRGVNGSTAASHLVDTDIEIFRPPPIIKQVANIEAVKILQRATQGFADGRASPELGELVFTGGLDRRSIELLEPYVKLVHLDAYEV